MYTIERTRDLSGLLAETVVWNRLAGGIPFRETSWLGPWWTRFGGNLEPFVLVARDRQGSLRGILPLYRSRNGSSGRTLSMIGDGKAYSDFVSILAEPEQALQVAQAMASFLYECAADTQDGWDVIDVDGVCEGDPAMTTLASELRERGASLHSHSRMSTWFLACDASWEDHIKSHGKTSRRKLRKWSTQIENTLGLQRHVVADDQQLVQSMDALIDLHQRRWNKDGQPGSFDDPEFEAFIRDSAADFHSRGRLYLSSLLMHDRIVAAELHFLGGNNRLYCYSSGYDTDSAEWEPGRLLHVDTLMHLYREKIDGIDFMRGDEPYKERAGAKPTRSLRMRIASPHVLPRLRHAAWCTGFEVKQWMRKRTGRTPLVVVDMPSTSNMPLGSCCD